VEQQGLNRNSGGEKNEQKASESKVIGRQSQRRGREQVMWKWYMVDCGE